MRQRAVGQLGLLDGLAAKVPGNEFLGRLEALVDWTPLRRGLEALFTATTGRLPRPPLVVFKMLLLQHCHGLSDPQCGGLVGDRLSWRRFVGLGLEEPVPDETTLVRFRQRLVQAGLHERLLGLVDRTTRTAPGDVRVCAFLFGPDSHSDWLSLARSGHAQGYLWTRAAPNGDVVFHWETSRAASCLGNVLPVDFTGTLQCDGYAAYPSFARQHPKPIQLAGCWAHVRRKFHEAREQTPRVTGWFLRQIQLLYQVEAALRETNAGPKLRDAVRAGTSSGICPRASSARPSTTRWPNGPPSPGISGTAASRSTTTASKTPSAPRRWGKRTGCSSAKPEPASAEPSSTRSSKAAAVADLIPTPTSRTS